MKKVIYIIGCFILSILIIALCNVNSDKADQYKNGFLRSFPDTSSLDRTGVLDIKFNDYYIAGLSKKNIYLGNFTAPYHLLVTNYTLTDTQHVKLNLPDKGKLTPGTIKVHIDSPDVFVAQPLVPALLHGTVTGSEYSTINTNDVRLNEFVPISTSNIILRTFSQSLGQNILVQITSHSQSVKERSFIMEKQMDGIFCTDGMLLYNQPLAQIIYIYHYRNQFVGLDTMFNVLYKGNTIDTTSRANIKTAAISKGKYMMTSRTKIVNKQSAVYKDLLYIHSGLLADNEQKNKFEKNSVVDVYSLKDQQYEFSFYIPPYNRKQMFDFEIFDKKVVVLYDHHIATYKTL